MAQQHPLLRKPGMYQKTVAVTTMSSGIRRMPVAVNAGANNLNAAHNPSGVPTVAVRSTNALRSQSR
jgi:hypothetical protein